jgi:hypothetical protein
MTDEGVFESQAVAGQAINIWSFDDIVSITTQRVGGLVVGKKENDVGLSWFGSSFIRHTATRNIAGTQSDKQSKKALHESFLGIKPIN